MLEYCYFNPQKKNLNDFNSPRRRQWPLIFLQTARVASFGLGTLFNHISITGTGIRYHFIYKWRREMLIDTIIFRYFVISNITHLVILEYPGGRGGDFGNVSRDHFGYRHDHWEITLHCTVVSHWLNPYPERPLCFMQLGNLSQSITGKMLPKLSFDSYDAVGW